MNLAVSFYQSDPSGIPNNWPKAMRELGQATGPLLAGEQLMTVEELETYRNARRAAYDSWRGQQSTSETTRIQVNITALRALFDDFQTSENNWDTLTAAQIQGLVRKHNQALLRLRPLFANLYQKEIERNA